MSSSGYEDLKLVKMILDINDRLKPSERDRTQELILFGASLEALRDLKEKVDRINERLSLIDIKQEIPTKKEEKSIIDQIKTLGANEKEVLLQLLNPPNEPIQDYNDHKDTSLENPLMDKIAMPIESVASRKKTVIKETIVKYGKITSSQLARIIGLSRTRCNEYLKELELSGELTAFTEDKKRYYQIKN